MHFNYFSFNILTSLHHLPILEGIQNQLKEVLRYLHKRKLPFKLLVILYNQFKKKHILFTLHKNMVIYK